ncbi:3-alpha domain protein [compost metagenome]
MLEAGQVQAGDTLQVVERQYAEWSVARLSAVLFDKRLEPELLHECLALPLVPSWRKTLERRVQQRQVEDWSKRLDGALQDKE